MTESVNFDGIPVKSALAVAVSMAVAGHAGKADAQQDGVSTGGIEEIIVTARKREESLQDIAGSIQVLTGDDLKRQGLLNLEDTVRMLPSVSSVGGTAGAQKIIFRGVSDNPGAYVAASSAALYIDEQPLTQFSVNPEPRMIDIQRVEALAGPQGTLYGDSSQSGTLRIITNKPDATEFSANAELLLRAGADSELSHELSAWLNLPLVENKFAIRLVGFSAKDGGFIDNVLGVSPMRGGRDNVSAVEDDVNYSEHIGGRISAKWFVNDEWSVTASAMAQNSDANGLNDFDPAVGDLETVKFFNDTRDDSWSQAAITIEGSLAAMEFTSITSYFDRELDYVYDRTTYSAYFNYNFCPLFATYCWSGVAGAENHYFGAGPIDVDPTTGDLTFGSTLRNDQDTIGFSTQNQENYRFTQEFRVSNSTDSYRWVLGVFYEEKSEQWEFRAQTPEFLNSLSYAYWTYLYAPTGVDPSWWLSSDDTDWEQWAVFGNFSYNLSEDLSVEVGARFFDQESERTYFVDKPFIVHAGFPDVTTPSGGNDDFVPKITVEYNLHDDKMMYALYSEGFRAGGVNRNRTPFTVFPQVWEPDLLKNFEIGAKTRWLDGTLQINATVYFGSWENYQIEAVDPSFRVCDPGEVADVDLCNQPFQVMVANVGDAEQTGLELDVRAAPADTLDLGLNVGWVKAETSGDFEVTIPVPKGTQLPNVPEFKVSAFAQASWPVFDGDTLYMRGQYTWQDESKNQLEEVTPGSPFDNTGAPFYTQPSYGVLDLKIGLQTNTWTLEGFVSNVADERAVLYNNPFFFDYYFGRNRVTTNRPREFGVRFSYNWQ